jgi:hypothetical protein
MMARTRSLDLDRAPRAHDGSIGRARVIAATFGASGIPAASRGARGARVNYEHAEAKRP